MRQSIKAAGLASLLLLSLTDLSAEPLVKGFFVEKLPANSLSQALAPGKGLVLAHVLNQSQEAITTGNYQVGVQIEDKGNIKTYSLSPKDSITPGALKTFRMAVPIDGIDKKTGSFKVFSRINGITTWSEKYSFLQGLQSSNSKNGVTTLFTEAPSPDEYGVIGKEVPFENQSSNSNNTLKSSSKKKNDSENKVALNNIDSTKVQKSNESKKEVVDSTKVAVSNAKDKANETLKKVDETNNKAKVVASEAKSEAIRKINPSEFKKLRTMDEELIIYVVKNGDTLKSISENYYGTASKERTIADLNFIEKSSSVRVGEEIIVEVRPLSSKS